MFKVDINVEGIGNISLKSKNQIDIEYEHGMIWATDSKNSKHYIAVPSGRIYYIIGSGTSEEGATRETDV